MWRKFACWNFPDGTSAVEIAHPETPTCQHDTHQQGRYANSSDAGRYNRHAFAHALMMMMMIERVSACSSIATST
jgi:hypothetical protein